MDKKVRIDKYLWAIRIFKTRSEAPDACSNGKVKFDEKPVKASKVVAIGDEYQIKTHARKWLIQVTNVISQRVDYQRSIECYVDKSPEDFNSRKQSATFTFYTGKRKSKQGRPTKKDKRELDNLRNDFYDF